MEEELIDYVYTQAKIAITDRLTSQSYLPVEEVRNDLIFGSRYILWSNNIDVVRLTWDGKESVFMTEVCNELPLNIYSPWVVVSIISFNPEFEDKDYLSEIIGRIVQSLD